MYKKMHLDCLQVITKGILKASIAKYRHVSYLHASKISTDDKLKHEGTCKLLLRKITAHKQQSDANSKVLGVGWTHCCVFCCCCFFTHLTQDNTKRVKIVIRKMC